jgi:hypothetical protein
MTKKKPIQHCRNFAPSTEEVNFLINSAKTLQHKVMLILLSNGMRESEVSHIQSDWVHINDNNSKHEGANFVSIEKKGQFCDCPDCLLQGYIKIQQERHPGEHSITWFKKKQHKFYLLKAKFKKYIIKQKKKYPGIHSVDWYKRKQRKFFIDKGFEKLNKTQWSPKTSAGERYVWILNDSYANDIKEFYSANKTIGMNRRQIYIEVKKMGMKLLKKKLFPHAIRSHSATKFAYSGLASASINTLLGWQTNLASTYVKTDSALALKDLKSKFIL